MERVNLFTLRVLCSCKGLVLAEELCASTNISLQFILNKEKKLYVIDMCSCGSWHSAMPLTDIWPKLAIGGR